MFYLANIRNRVLLQNIPGHCDRVPMTRVLGQSTYQMILIA